MSLWPPPAFPSTIASLSEPTQLGWGLWDVHLTEPSPSGTEQGPEGGLGWSAKVHAARPPVHSGPVALAWLTVAALDESSHRRLSCEIPLEFLIVHDPKLILESEVTLRPGR